MMKPIDKITYRNGFRRNDKPATLDEVAEIYESRKEAALIDWEQHKKQKVKSQSQNK
ncbi:hypothetical protein [Xenorhabdus szentirmaii]|uniref:Uncharacterized protein n=1 Tax=Xenorhabdus szentirmaii DSM 16338 TaxID=1427518 RepID=W1J4V3_9GAMM|nr:MULTISPECIES: hypothetical protein [Xenorhabdus]MBD2779876.1 hypothetical protein [Xenorhabdus sp. 38]MBD2822119.1 hypothetical protein [Xenorhabdus sp. 42]PHM32101.1 hypothetical protein Xsze_02831 [Xenorhabdus szentirmaii DSM 16338]PHM41607.1 hypothetical protein Xszus_01300 [Xenorhabdus szentirmaii]CDL84881.1 conserved hypothetical protein [Xenorhabdus szentirmaii DSM 16338]